MEPTPEMLNAGAMRVAMNAQFVGTAEAKAAAVWRDMVAAAPCGVPVLTPFCTVCVNGKCTARDGCVIASNPPSGVPASAPGAWASRAFDPDTGPRGQWTPWRITDYKPPREPDQWFQVVALPAAAGVAPSVEPSFPRPDVWRTETSDTPAGVPGTAVTISTGANDDPSTAVSGSPGAADGQPGGSRIRDASDDGSRDGLGGRHAGSGEQPGSPAVQGDRRGDLRAREAAKVLALLPRIDAAIQRIVNGQGCMRIPAELTDPDLVLADCKRLLSHVCGVSELDAQTKPPAGTDAQEGKR
jgi:hypothetical protein